MRVTYQSPRYAPELVTGRYVRVISGTAGGMFRVSETATGTGRFAGKPGHGPTLREYEATGDDLPEAIRALALKTRSTEAWPL